MQQFTPNKEYEMSRKENKEMALRQIMTARSHDGQFFLSIIKVDPGQYHIDPEVTYSLCAFGGDGPTYRTLDMQQIKGGRESAITAFMMMFAKYEDKQTFQEAMDRTYHLTDEYRYSKEALEEFKIELYQEVPRRFTKEEADQFYNNEKESRSRMYWRHFSE